MNRVECQAFMKDFFERYYDMLLKKDEELVKLPDLPREMWAADADLEEEWKKWRLVPSTVTEKEINELEKEIGIRFPIAFRAFLCTYFHCFEEGIGKNTCEEHFEGVYNAWNPILVKTGYLPFSYDPEGYFIRCIKLDAMPDEEKCGIYQIDHEILFDFEEDTVSKREIDANMEYISQNFFEYLKNML